MTNFKQTEGDSEGWPYLEQRLREMPVKRLRTLVSLGQARKEQSGNESIPESLEDLVRAVAQMTDDECRGGFEKLWELEGKLPVVAVRPLSCYDELIFGSNDKSEGK